MKRIVGRALQCLATGAGLVLSAGTALADRPRPWEMGLQAPASPVADRLEALHTELLYIITVIVVFVLGLLLYVCIRYRAKAHPVPTRTSHNTVVEIAWTVVPVLILAFIAVPSFKLLYFEQDIPKDAALTLKVTGIQWYWHYAYPTNGNFGFDSTMADPKTLKDPGLRLLAADNPVVLPVGEDIKVDIASNDVMHSWFVPSLAVQRYAVPGHINEIWVRIDRPGTYYGECNQLCGINHAFMPIEIKAVTPAEFTAWVAQAKQKFAREDSPAGPQVAAASASR